MYLSHQVVRASTQVRDSRLAQQRTQPNLGSQRNRVWVGVGDKALSWGHVDVGVSTVHAGRGDRWVVRRPKQSSGLPRIFHGLEASLALASMGNWRCPFPMTWQMECSHRDPSGGTSVHHSQLGASKLTTLTRSVHSTLSLVSSLMAGTMRIQAPQCLHLTTRTTRAAREGQRE